MRVVGLPEHGLYRDKLSELVIGRAKHPWRRGSGFEQKVWAYKRRSLIFPIYVNLALRRLMIP